MEIYTGKIFAGKIIYRHVYIYCKDKKQNCHNPDFYNRTEFYIRFIF